MYYNIYNYKTFFEIHFCIYLYNLDTPYIELDFIYLKTSIHYVMPLQYSGTARSPSRFINLNRK